MDQVACLIGEYRVASEKRLIDILLSSLQGLSIQRQLKKQQILRFHVGLLNPDIEVAEIIEIMGGFEIELDNGRVNEWCEDIGHELAHAFFYKKARSQTKPQLRFENEMTTKEEDRLEDFCDRFAVKWRIQNQHEFDLLLSQYGFSEEGLNKLLKK